MNAQFFSLRRSKSRLILFSLLCLLSIIAFYQLINHFILQVFCYVALSLYYVAVIRKWEVNPLLEVSGIHWADGRWLLVIDQKLIAYELGEKCRAYPWLLICHFRQADDLTQERYVSIFHDMLSKKAFAAFKLRVRWHSKF